jgi:hypothetical protein
MQVHGPTEITDQVSTYLNPGDGRPFAVLHIGSVSVYLTDADDAGKLIEAATEAKRLLLDAAKGEGK